MRTFKFFAIMLLAALFYVPSSVSAQIYSENIIPVMTGETSPNGDVIFSGWNQDFTTVRPYRAFDHILYGSPWAAGNASGKGTTSGWIGFSFNEPKKVTKYSISNWNPSITNASASPRDWTFQGSNDGSTWHTLDTRTGQSINIGQTKSFEFNNENEFLMYRLNITRNNGHASVLNVSELQMFETLDVTPPEPPIGLEADPQNGRVILTWQANSETDLAGYNVYRDGVKINANLITTTSYTDSDVTNGVTYEYFITAVDTSDNESDPSNVVQATPGILPPQTPKNLKVNPGDTTLQVVWKANNAADLAGYNIYVDDLKINTEPITTTSYIITGLTNFQTYKIQVSAVNVYDMESALSDPVYGTPETPDLTPPDAPEGLQAFPGDREVSLFWDPNTEDDLRGYFVYRDGVQLNANPITEPSYTDTKLSNGATYTYTIRAVDMAGNLSDPSDPVEATPQEPASTPPQNLRAKAGNERVTLTWNEKYNATYYLIYRDGDIIAVVTDTTYVDEDVENGRLYTYAVSAIVDDTETDRSKSVTARPGDIVDFTGEPPGVVTILKTAWSFLSRFNEIIIFILAVILAPTLIGFLYWLLRRKKQQAQEEKELQSIAQDHHPEARRIIERLTEQERRHLAEVERMREAGFTERERKKRIRAIRREQTVLRSEAVREYRRSREARELRYAGREERTARPERGARRGRE